MTTFFKRLWKPLAILAIVFLLLIGYTAWQFGGSFCMSANRTVALPSDLAVEPVTFPSESGSTVHGWLVTPPTNHGVVILQHGLRGNRRDMLGRAQFLSRAGYAVLLYDFQGHGESLGKIITLGYLESRDSTAAVAFVKKQFPGKPVAVIGVSLGAAAAVLPQHPLDVQAMVLEIMYPTVIEATKDRMEIRLGPWGRYISPLLTCQVPLRLGCSTSDLCPIDHVGKITVPKLFLAGTEDQDTKFAESQAIFKQAAEPKTFVAFQGARHQDLHAIARDRYEQLVLKFLGDNLKQ